MTTAARGAASLAGGAGLPVPGLQQINPGHSELAFILRHLHRNRARSGAVMTRHHRPMLSG